MARKSKAVAGLEVWLCILWRQAADYEGRSPASRFDEWRCVRFQLWGMQRAFCECGEESAAEIAGWMADIAGERAVML